MAMRYVATEMSHGQLSFRCKEATAKLSLANISGDMNHVYRVDITYTSAQKEQERVHHEASFSVVVKMASKNVLVNKLTSCYLSYFSVSVLLTGSNY